MDKLYDGQPSGFPCIAEWTLNATPKFSPYYKFIEDKRKFKSFNAKK